MMRAKSIMVNCLVPRGFEQNAVGHADFADIVQRGRTAQ